MYRIGLLLYRSISSSCLRTFSRLDDDKTLISSRVISFEPWILVTVDKAWTSGKLFLRWRALAGVSWGQGVNKKPC